MDLSCGGPSGTVGCSRVDPWRPAVASAMSVFLTTEARAEFDRPCPRMRRRDSRTHIENTQGVGSGYIFDFDGASWGEAEKLVPEPSASLLGATVLVLLLALARRKPVDIDRG